MRQGSSDLFIVSLTVKKWPCLKLHDGVKTWIVPIHVVLFNIKWYDSRSIKTNMSDSCSGPWFNAWITQVGHKEYFINNYSNKKSCLLHFYTIKYCANLKAPLLAFKENCFSEFSSFMGIFSRHTSWAFFPVTLLLSKEKEKAVAPNMTSLMLQKRWPTLPLFSA